MLKFVFIGLPGVGKSSTLKRHVDRLNKQGIKANLIITDDLISQRIKNKDSTVQQYEKNSGLKISSEISDTANPSQEFIKIYGIEAMSHLEEMLLIDIIHSSQTSDWLDLGGRAPLLPGVLKALKAKGIMLVLLDATHETIIKRLEKEGEVQKRPTYALAAEKDPKGWIANAEKHRAERLEKYKQSADLILSVEKPQTALKEKEKTILCKSLEEILTEIDDKIKKNEFLNLPNKIDGNFTHFFENTSLDESSGDQKSLKTKLTARL